MDGKINLSLDLDAASALYLLIDNSLSSYNIQLEAINNMILGNIPIPKELAESPLPDLKEELEALIAYGKQVSKSVGSMILTLSKDEEFKPFVKDTDKA